MQAFNNKILECRVRENVILKKKSDNGRVYLSSEKYLIKGKRTCFTATEVATLSIQVCDANAPGPSTEDKSGEMDNYNLKNK